MLQSSRNSLVLVLEDVNATLDAGDALALGEGLIGISGVLADHVALRKSMVDVSIEPQAKQETLQNLFGGKVDARALELTSRAAARRFARPQDFVTAIETAGVTAIAAAAQSAGQLGQLEEELFRFNRLLVANYELDAALESNAPADSKAELVNSVLDGKVLNFTKLLAEYVVRHPRGIRVSETLENFSEVLAFRQQRAVAEVTVAKPMSAEQEERLQRALSASYGRELVLNVSVDPEVVGGVRVQVGDEVISSTIADRLADIRRRLAS